MTATDLSLLTVIVAFAAITQAITGFGFTLLALGVLGCWMDLREASILIAPAGLVMNLLLFFRLRTHFRWEGLVPLFIAGLAGVPLGTLLLLYVDLRVLEFGLAVVMFASAFQGLHASRRANRQPWHQVAAGVPCGFLGGLLTGAFGTGGPPVVSYLLNRPINRFEFIASIQALFALSATVRVTQFIVMGRLDRSFLPALLPATAAAAIGVSVGVHLLHRMSDQLVRKIVLWFVVVCGARYLWAALA